jgi:hypothetical protein
MGLAGMAAPRRPLLTTLPRRYGSPRETRVRAQRAGIGAVGLRSAAGPIAANSPAKIKIAGVGGSRTPLRAAAAPIHAEKLVRRAWGAVSKRHHHPLD